MKRAWFVTVVAMLAGVCLAQSPRQVEVVTEASRTNQTGTVTGPLFTPNETGMFRVNFYVQCTKGDPVNGQGLGPMLYWKDDNGREQLFLGSVSDKLAGLPTSYVFIIKASEGQPITWAVNTYPPDDSEYEVYLALERIGPKVQ